MDDGRTPSPPSAQICSHLAAAARTASVAPVEISGEIDKSQGWEGYKNYLKLHILPKWGDHSLSAIKSVEVESWLRSLKTATGKPASPGTQTKIRSLMSAIFSHAIRHEWAARNPISSVRTSAKRLRTPEILTAAEFRALILALR